MRSRAIISCLASIGLFTPVLLLQGCSSDYHDDATTDDYPYDRPVSDSQRTIDMFKREDPSIQRFFDNSYGYAVFPTVGKGAVGVGGAHGDGIVYEQGVSVGTTELTQVTVGLQLGGQSFSEIIFFQDK